jgi:hypothetical protein
MTAATPGQAAWSAHDRARGATGSKHTWSFVDPKEQAVWEGIAQVAIAAQQPQPQPVPAMPERPGYVTVDARDIAIALNGYAGFTGDPVSFASALHERLRRTVFADGTLPPQAAPELAAAMAETRDLRALAAEILGSFSPTGGGMSSRVGQVQIAKWARRAGLESARMRELLKTSGG